MKLIIGTAQFGLNYGISNTDGKTPGREVNEILQFADSNKIVTLDTAYMYCDSENTIGLYLKSHPNEKWDVISKLPKLENNENIKSSFDEIFHQSKALLGNSLNTYLAHDAKQFLYNQTVRNRLHFIKQKGLVSKIGVSVYSEEEINEVLKLSDIDVIQLPLNVLDHRLIKSNTLKRIKQHDIEIHVRSVFLQGLFFLSDMELKAKFLDAFDAINIIKNIAMDYNLNLRDLALLFVKNIPEVDKIIIGVNNLKQLKDNISSYKKTCNDDVIDQILDQVNFNDEAVLNPTNWVV